MKHKLNIFIILIIAFTLVVSFMTISSIADMGDFSGNSDYGSGGGGDSWGGGDSGYGGSIVYSSIGEVPFYVWLIVLGFIIYFLYVKYAKKSPTAQGAVGINQSLLKPMSEFKLFDPEFSDEAFTEKLANMYVQFQNHWQHKNMEPMRSNMTDAFYNQILRQLQPYITNNQTNRVEHIAVLGIVLRGWMKDDVNDIIVARIRTRIIDYVVSDINNAIVRGNNSKELFMEYEWTMIRRSGVLTPDLATPSTVHCTSCGAPMDVNHSAKCEYCGSVMTNSDYDWVLSSIKGISQRTG